MLLKVVWPWNDFESFVEFSTIRLQGEVNFVIKEFLEVFYFASDFTVVAKKNWKRFVRSSNNWELSPLEVYISFMADSRKI